MADVVLTIRDAVRAAIAAADLSLAATILAPFRRVSPGKSDHGVYVLCYPRTDETESWLTDGTDASKVTTAVVVRKNLDDGSDEEIAVLFAFAREIRDVLRNAHPLTEIDGFDVNLESISHDPLWSVEEIGEQETFISIILVAHRAEYEV